VSESSKLRIPKDQVCDCGHAHFDHHGTDGGKCLKCICLQFRRTVPYPFVSPSLSYSLSCTLCRLECEHTEEEHLILSTGVTPGYDCRPGGGTLVDYDSPRTQLVLERHRALKALRRGGDHVA
jgi:hypothetical protein